MRKRPNVTDQPSTNVVARPSDLIVVLRDGVRARELKRMTKSSPRSKTGFSSGEGRWRRKRESSTAVGKERIWGVAVWTTAKERKERKTRRKERDLKAKRRTEWLRSRHFGKGEGRREAQRRGQPRVETAGGSLAQVFRTGPRAVRVDDASDEQESQGDPRGSRHPCATHIGSAAALSGRQSHAGLGVGSGLMRLNAARDDPCRHLGRGTRVWACGGCGRVVARREGA